MGRFKRVSAKKGAPSASESTSIRADTPWPPLGRPFRPSIPGRLMVIQTAQNGASRPDPRSTCPSKPLSQPQWSAGRCSIQKPGSDACPRLMIRRLSRPQLHIVDEGIAPRRPIDSLETPTPTRTESAMQHRFNQPIYFLWRCRFRSLRCLCLRIFLRRFLITLPTGSPIWMLGQAQPVFER